LIAHNANTGQREWYFNFRDLNVEDGTFPNFDSRASVAVGEEHLYLNAELPDDNYGRGIYRVNKTNHGDNEFLFEANTSLSSSPAYDGETLYFGGEDGVYAYSTENESLEWKRGATVE
jgi:hypothetical protein